MIFIDSRIKIDEFAIDVEISRFLYLGQIVMSTVRTVIVSLKIRNRLVFYYE